MYTVGITGEFNVLQLFGNRNQDEQVKRMMFYVAHFMPCHLCDILRRRPVVFRYQPYLVLTVVILRSATIGVFFGAAVRIF